MGGDFAAADSVTYGVNFQSALNQLHYFHVANSQLPQDIMHVLLEGVVKMELSLLLNYLVSSRYMTESLLNDRIENFHYTINEKRNKPCPIDLKSSSFHQTAAGMITFYVHVNMILINHHGNLCAHPDIVYIARYHSILVEFFSCYHGDITLLHMG